jgi:hypothetical protein
MFVHSKNRIFLKWFGAVPADSVRSSAFPVKPGKILSHMFVSCV